MNKQKHDRDRPLEIHSIVSIFNLNRKICRYQFYELQISVMFNIEITSKHLIALLMNRSTIVRLTHEFENLSE